MRPKKKVQDSVKIFDWFSATLEIFFRRSKCKDLETFRATGCRCEGFAELNEEKKHFHNCGRAHSDVNQVESLTGGKTSRP